MWGVLLAVALGLVVSPAFAVAAACPDDDDDACCGLDCALCLCCSSVPRTTLPFAGGGPATIPTGSVGADATMAPPGPLPRDVLHVPKSPPAR